MNLHHDDDKNVEPDSHIGQPAQVAERANLREHEAAEREDHFRNNDCESVVSV